MHDGNRCVAIKEAVLKGEFERREMVGEKDSQRRGMALKETTETVRLSERSGCAISPQDLRHYFPWGGLLTDLPLLTG